MEEIQEDGILPLPRDYTDLVAAADVDNVPNENCNKEIHRIDERDDWFTENKHKEIVLEKKNI